MSQVLSASQIAAGQFISRKYNVLIDTDIGDDIDDALALALALCSSEIELLGVTTVFGDTRRRAKLAAHVLKVYRRREIPVAAGQQVPLLLSHRPSGVPQAPILDPGTSNDVLSRFTALLIQPRLFLAITNIVMIGGTTGFPIPEWNMRCQLRESDLEKMHYQNTPQTRLIL